MPPRRIGIACRDAAAGARCGYGGGAARPRRDRRTGRSGSSSSTTGAADSDRPSLGTMVDVEGGPGYSTTDSRELLPRAAPAADGEPRPAARRRARHRALRPARLPGAAPHGRGLRAPRRPLRRAARAARRSVRDACGRRRPRGGAGRAGIARIDLYGDSYGTYVGQTFAVRHGDRLRSLVLDADLPGAGDRPRVRRPRRGDLARAAAGVRATPGVRRGSGGGAGAAWWTRSGGGR